MPNYDKATGTAGTLRISDNGTTVSFIIMCSDGATNVGSLTWSGTVNGSPVGGTVTLGAGFGSRTVGSWTVSTTQTVTFAIPATGTSGLGGPTSHSVGISRGGVPGAPGTPVVSAINSTGATFTWTAAAGNGSTPNHGLYVSERSDFSTHVYAAWLGTGVLTKTLSGILVPGVKYWTRARAQNAYGTGPYSAAATFTTIAGAYVSDGTSWQVAPVFVSDGTTWRAAVLTVSDGSAWDPVG